MHPGVILLTLLIVVLVVASWLKRAPNPQIPPSVRTALLVVAGGIVLLVTVRFHPAFALLALVPLLQRMLAASRASRSAAGPSPGRRSEVTTDYLHMSIDHDSGVMTGSVLKGALEGRSVGELSRAQLLDLLDECRAHDAQSASVLESYLDRRFGDEWERPGDDRRRADRPASADGEMTRAQAFQILGLDSQASDKDIVEAHRRLMQRLHPDRGGSGYLAAQINRAKDLLLGTGAARPRPR